MKLIYYELKKVLSKRLFISLCVFCFAVNLCAFYFTHNENQAEMYREWNPPMLNPAMALADFFLIAL